MFPLETSFGVISFDWKKTRACQKKPTTFGNGNLETLKPWNSSIRFSIRWHFSHEAVEETITEVHLCTVDLAERVLPALQKIGASALGFAVVSGSGEMDVGKMRWGCWGWTIAGTYCWRNLPGCNLCCRCMPKQSKILMWNPNVLQLVASASIDSFCFQAKRQTAAGLSIPNGDQC